MQSQQLMWHNRVRELHAASKQQPSSLPRKRPVGIEAGLTAVVLAALGFCLVLGYAALSALSTRNGYTEIGLRREIEDLRARNALLRYQVHLTESNGNVQAAAEDLGLRPADPVREVDYVILPYSTGADGIQIAADSDRRGMGVTAVLGQLAAEVVTAGSRADASTVSGHRP